MTQFKYETDGGATGVIEAATIEEAREVFRAEHPDVRSECAGIWGPDDPEYDSEDSPYREIKVVFDDRDPDNSGWFARAYLSEGGDEEIQIEAESWEEAVIQTRERFKWLNYIAVYESISADQPSRHSPPIS